MQRRARFVSSKTNRSGDCIQFEARREHPPEADFGRRRVRSQNSVFASDKETIMTSKIVLGSLAAALSVVACSSSSSNDTTPPAGDAGPSDTGTADSGPGTDSGPSAEAHVRVAHLSPDAPAVDFCLAAHGTTTFTGPVLASKGGSTGISYPSVTEYLAVPAGQYDVRIVAPGSTSCATSLASLPDFTDLPALPAGASATIAAEGDVTSGATNPFALKAYIDDATVASGKASLRFVHASPGTPAVDVGLSGGVLFTPLFTNVAFGAIGTGGSLDANGYLVTTPFTSAEISARAHGSLTDALSIDGAALPAGAIATAFAIGTIGDTAHPLAVLLCVDNGTPSGILSSCSVVGATPKRANVRVAHLSPDAPAVDVCITPTGTAFSGKPILGSLGDASGISYPSVTVYVQLPVAAYDLRVVAAGAADCSTKAIPDTTNVAVTNGLDATVAALGDFTVAGSDPAIALKVFVDDPTVAATSTALRFIHASPGTPAVDVGTGSAAAFSAIFTDVSFGNVGTGGTIDSNGYFVTTPITGATISARAHGASTDAIVVPNVSLPAAQITTAFAIGGKTGDTAHPLAVFVCDDNAATSGLLTTCTTAQ
jgi:hypothetical protein